MLSLPERFLGAGQSEAARKALENAAFDLRVSLPGIVQSFDAVKQTVKVQPCIRERLVLDDKVQWTPLPILVDVPVVFPRAGNFVLTMPVTAGDEALIIFGDNCYDAWWQSGGVQNQIDRRRHDLSDGFAVMGLWSQPKVVQNYSIVSAQLRSLDGATMIEVTGSDVNIKTSGNTNITAAGATNITSTGDTKITAANASVKATTKAEIEAPTVNIKSSAISLGSSTTNQVARVGDVCVPRGDGNYIITGGSPNARA